MASFNNGFKCISMSVKHGKLTFEEAFPARTNEILHRCSYLNDAVLWLFTLCMGTFQTRGHVNTHISRLTYPSCACLRHGMQRQLFLVSALRRYGFEPSCVSKDTATSKAGAGVWRAEKGVLLSFLTIPMCCKSFACYKA